MPLSPSLRSRFLGRQHLLVLLLLVGALVAYLAGNNLFPLIDRDEPRFAQASKQMLETGDWTTPRFLDRLRLNKPVLIYWLQATAMRTFGPTGFAARLPSSLAAVATLAMFALSWPSIVGHRRALWATFIFATALMPVYLAKVCMADAVQHLFIAASMLCLYAVWRGTARWPTMIVLGVSIGLAMLTKGPPVLMHLGMTLVALWLLNQSVTPTAPTMLINIEHDLPRIFVRVLIVITLAAAVCVPWVMKLEKAHPGAILKMFSTEIVERGFDEKEGHTGPPGFYFVTFWVTYFPWCLFWPAALLQGWKRRHIPWVRFSLAAILGPWVFLEIYKTKLPHYWLPSYPFMALLTADVLVRGIRARIADLRDRPFLIGAIVWGVAACIVAGIFVAIPFLGDRAWASFPVAILFASGIVLLVAGVVTLLHRKRLEAAALSMGLGTITVIMFATCVYLPNVRALMLASRIAEKLRAIPATEPGQEQMIGFKEPSLAFYQGGTIREQSDSTYLATTPEADWPRWTVIDDDAWKATLAKNPAVESRMISQGTFIGANIADGKKQTTVHVFEKKLTPEDEVKKRE
jgi:4-amino-4-deoxy-L-arabinose transferase-like glycosyltransferase